MRLPDGGFVAPLRAQAAYEQGGVRQNPGAQVDCRLDRSTRVVAFDDAVADVADEQGTSSLAAAPAGERPFDDGSKE